MKIYCIEDINDLKYVGKTNNKLSIRLSQHKYDKYNNNRSNVSSEKLNLYNCIIYELEECEEHEAYEREIFYMEKLNSINKRTGQSNDKEYVKNQKQKYYLQNREKIKKYYSDNRDYYDNYRRKYYLQNREKIIKQNLEYYYKFKS